MITTGHMEQKRKVQLIVGKRKHYLQVVYYIYIYFFKCHLFLLQQRKENLIRYVFEFQLSVLNTYELRTLTHF